MERALHISLGHQEFILCKVVGNSWLGYIATRRYLKARQEKDKDRRLSRVFRLANTAFTLWLAADGILALWRLTL
jgi:hypothetical protein